ncbi:MAG: 4-hydroxybutyrate CoA-transferase, partial [Desulfitobacteriaceae bacterium]|nr:4-hydroxybutyrate CoA-transferase [Desulfitobacteriaceae bacterium]
MNKWQEQYKQKLMSAEDAVKLIKPGAYCCAPIGVGEPPALLEAMVDCEGLTDVKVSQMIANQKLRYLDPEYSNRFRHISWFTAGASRAAVQEGRADFVPCFYHEIPMFHRDYWEHDVFFATVSRMDKHGWFSFGAAVSEAHAMMSKSKCVILEVNNHMPRVLGNSMVHISEIDALIENHT